MSALSAEHALKGRILAATHELLKEADWGLNLQICDELNSRPALGPTLIKYIKPRLEHKQQSVGTLALQLLSSVVDNCPKVRGVIADPEFLTFLVETLPKSIRQPLKKHLFGGRPVTDIEEMARCDKLLSLIRKWSNAFRSNEQLCSFNDVFRKLSLDGVKFPLPQPGEEAPVITPDVNPDYSRPSPARASEQKGVDGGNAPAASTAKASTPAAPAPTVAAAAAPQLPFPGADFANNECRGAMEAIHMLQEVLNESDPSEDLRKNEVVQTLLAATIAPYKDRFTKRVTNGGCRSDRELGEHISTIDALVEIVAFYEGLVNGTRKRTRKVAAPVVAPTAQASHSAQPHTRAEPTFVPAPALQPASQAPIPARGVDYDLSMPIGAVADPRTGMIPAVRSGAAPHPISPHSIASSASATSNEAFLTGKTSIAATRLQPAPPAYEQPAPTQGKPEVDPFLAMLTQATQQASASQVPPQSQPQPQSSGVSAALPIVTSPAAVLPAPTAPAPGRARVRGGSTSGSIGSQDTAQHQQSQAALQSQPQQQQSSSSMDPLALLNSLSFTPAPSSQPVPVHNPAAAAAAAATSTDPFFALFSNQPSTSVPVQNQNTAGTSTTASATPAVDPIDDPFFAIATGR